MLRRTGSGRGSGRRDEESFLCLRKLIILGLLEVMILLLGNLIRSLDSNIVRNIVDMLRYLKIMLRNITLIFAIVRNFNKVEGLRKVPRCLKLLFS